MALPSQRSDTIRVEPDLVLVLDRHGICHEYLTHHSLLSSDPMGFSPRDQAVGQAIEQFLPSSLVEQLRPHLRTVGGEGAAFSYTGQSLHRYTLQRLQIVTGPHEAQTPSRPLHYAVRLDHCGNERFLGVIRHLGVEEPHSHAADGDGHVTLYPAVVPLRDREESVGHVAVGQSDGAGLQRLEAQVQQVQNLEAMSRLAAKVAHDFNNILTVIANYGELLLSLLPRTNPLYNHVQKIQQAEERAAHLTQQLLTFSRRQRSDLALLDLNHLVQSSEYLLRRFAGEEITWISELATNLATIRADRKQMEELLSNLIANACEAMPQGGLLSIRTENVCLTDADLPAVPGLQSGNYVRLTIRDNGEGMDEEVQRYLFEPFFTTKAARHGIGLGLSTVYGIVRQHQGFIEVESVKDVGTSLYVFFPSVAQPIDSSDCSASDAPSLPDAPVQSPKIILIVDDEEPILALMAMILEEAGYIVLQANRGSVALNLAQQGQTPDLLLSDVAMPEMNGHELYRALLPRLPDLKVLFVSGYTEMHALPDGKESARMAFLGKPFTWQQLLQKVEEMVNN